MKRYEILDGARVSHTLDSEDETLAIVVGSLLTDGHNEMRRADGDCAVILPKLKGSDPYCRDHRRSESEVAAVHEFFNKLLGVESFDGFFRWILQRREQLATVMVTVTRADPTNQDDDEIRQMARQLAVKLLSINEEEALAEMAAEDAAEEAAVEAEAEALAKAAETMLRDIEAELRAEDAAQGKASRG